MLRDGVCEELSLAPPKPVSVFIDGVTTVWVGQVWPQTSRELSQWEDSEGRASFGNAEGRSQGS